MKFSLNNFSFLLIKLEVSIIII